MALSKKLSFVFCLLGLILYLPPARNWLTIYLGETIGLFSGMVVFIMGWSVLGAGLAFSAGSRHQRRCIEKTKS